MTKFLRDIESRLKPLRIVSLIIGRKLQTLANAPGFQNFVTSFTFHSSNFDKWLPRIDFKAQILNNALFCIDFKVLHSANSIFRIEITYFLYSLFRVNLKLWIFKNSFLMKACITVNFYRSLNPYRCGTPNFALWLLTLWLFNCIISLQCYSFYLLN